MKVSEQCGIAASKGNQIVGVIRRAIMYQEKQLIVPQYKTIVRPHLEYCIQAWRPYRKKDIDKLDRIQQRATKMIPELRDLRYESRLLQCGLTILETTITTIQLHSPDITNFEPTSAIHLWNTSGERMPNFKN